MPMPPPKVLVHLRDIGIFRWLVRAGFHAVQAITCVVWTSYVGYFQDFGDEGEVDFGKGGGFGGRVAQMLIPHLTELTQVMWMNCYEENRGPEQR